MKIVLAYSGGLDTSVLLSWIKETYEAEMKGIGPKSPADWRFKSLYRRFTGGIRTRFHLSNDPGRSGL
jgi:hypothetical protein